MSQILQDLCREALVWRQLHHENILLFCGIDSEYFMPRYCLISPWMKNGNIIHYLESHPDHDCLKCVCCDGLYLCLHTNNIPE